MFNIALLIDDDPVNNFVSYAVLKRAGIVKDIQIENSGPSALIFLQEYYSSRRNLPKLIFLDLNMPVMDGFQFIQEFDRRFKFLKEKVTIIILSATINEKDKSEAAKLGIRYFIQKPLSEDVVKEFIMNLSEIPLASIKEKSF